MFRGLLTGLLLWVFNFTPVCVVSEKAIKRKVSQMVIGLIISQQVDFLSRKMFHSSFHA